MSELFIVVGLEAKEGKADELRRDLTALVAPSLAEEGNLSYDLYEDIGEPGKFVALLTSMWIGERVVWGRGW
jgi:quinol monooxygenase YgiN